MSSPLRTERASEEGKSARREREDPQLDFLCYVPVYGEGFSVHSPYTTRCRYTENTFSYTLRKTGKPPTQSFLCQDGNCITDFIVAILDSRLVFLARLVSGRAGPVRSSRRSQRELLRLSPDSASKKKHDIIINIYILIKIPFFLSFALGCIGRRY